MDDTSVDWAERRKKTRRDGHFLVRFARIIDCADTLDSSEGIVVLQAVHLDDETALTLAKRSRLFVLTATPLAADLEATERLLRHVLEGGITSDGLAVVLCSPLPDCSRSAFLPAMQRISRMGIQDVRHSVPGEPYGWTAQGDGMDDRRKQQLIFSADGRTGY